MALPAQLPSYTQAGANDHARCGLPFHCNDSAAVNASSSAQASGARLLGAALTGDIAQAMRCLADGADISFEDPNSGETALHRAAQGKYSALIDLLLAAGADVNRRDRHDRTPLFFAANAGDVQSVQKLLAHNAQLFPDQESCQSQLGCTSSSSSSSSTCTNSAPVPTPHSPDTVHANSEVDDDDATLLALRTTCPLAAAAAAAHWPTVAALLTALPPHYQRLRPALRSLRFLVWALASHKAFPREVIHRLPRRLPRCVVDAVRPAHIASTPLVLATGNDQQQLMQWLLQQGADPELGAPLLLCAGRFCRGSRTCCVNTLLRRGARPHVAWADNPSDSPLQLAARGDCFTHVHCLVAYGADVAGEAARVRQALYTPPAWEAHLDALMRQYGDLVTAPGADLLCPCGQQHARWPGLWPQEGEEETDEEAEAEMVAGSAAVPGAGGNSCHNPTPSDDAWYRHHSAQMEQLQDGTELAECRKAVDDLWQYGCSSVTSELGGAPAAPHSLLPQRVLAALHDVAGGWLVAAARCRQQRQLRADLYDKAVAAGRVLLDRKRVAALAALGGGRQQPAGCSPGGGAPDCSGGGVTVVSGCNAAPASLRPHAALSAELVPRRLEGARVEGRDADGAGAGGDATGTQAGGGAAAQGLALELRMEILALAGLAPPEVQPQAVSAAVRSPCDCPGCKA